MSDDRTLDVATAVDDEGKRDFIFIATGAAAAAGAVSLGWPLVAQMGKDADTLAAGSIAIDVSKDAEGQQDKL